MATSEQHLWLHFSRLADRDAPIIARGDGCYDIRQGEFDAIAGILGDVLGEASALLRARS